MCTVSVVPHEDGARLVSNRDERHSRAAARPPSWWRLGPRRALFPIDAEAGGTWVGVNDAGLAVAVLNRHAAEDDCRREASSVPPLSRGAIVPLLLSASRPDEVLGYARRIRRALYRPFRVLAAGHGLAAIVSAGPDDFHEVCVRLDTPLLLTSSSLGDALVDAPRRALFAAMMNTPAADWLAAQRRFHAHRWPAIPELSVVMSRHDARTVSRTTCEMTRTGAVRMTYEALDGSAALRLAS